LKSKGGSTQERLQGAKKKSDLFSVFLQCRGFATATAGGITRELPILCTVEDPSHSGGFVTLGDLLKKVGGYLGGVRGAEKVKEKQDKTASNRSQKNNLTLK